MSDTCFWAGGVCTWDLLCAILAICSHGINLLACSWSGLPNPLSFVSCLRPYCGAQMSWCTAREEQGKFPSRWPLRHVVRASCCHAELVVLLGHLCQSCVSVHRTDRQVLKRAPAMERGIDAPQQGFLHTRCMLCWQNCCSCHE